MDLATLIGILGAFGVVGSSIVLGGNPLIFLNVPSLLIVCGGSIMVVLMKFSLTQFFGSVKVAIKAFFITVTKIEDLIALSLELVNKSRKEGLLALEEVEITDPFMKQGVQLLVDGHPAELIKEILHKDMQLTVERHNIGNKIFKSMADVAPAMGMIGTLIGLVQMLSAMDDPKSIGPSMAVALLTTLYGAVIANIIATPIADKLSLRSAEEKTRKSLIIDTLMGIESGRNPRVIEESLKQYLPVSKRNTEVEEEPAAEPVIEAAVEATAEAA